VRERLVSQRTGIINQIRAFMLNADRRAPGYGFLRRNCPPSLRRRTDALSPRIVACHRGLAGDWRRLIRASMAYPARSKHWPVKIRHVRA